MKITQKNTDNTTGFVQKEIGDFGLDQTGNLADGFQYHDALWWSGSKGNPLHAQLGISGPSLITFLENFKKIFTHIATFVIDQKPKYVLELGCGSGELSQYIRNMDKDIVTVTVDANVETKNSPYCHENHFIGRTDQILDFVDQDGNKIIFDMIISFEHFEHISETTFSVIMDNIKNHSKTGTKLFFSVNLAPYGAADHKHIHCNIKPVDYWKDYITKNGFKIQPIGFVSGRASNSLELFCVKE